MSTRLPGARAWMRGHVQPAMPMPIQPDRSGLKPGRYVMNWGGRDQQVDLYLAGTELRFRPASGYSHPVFTVPDATFTPIPAR